MEKRGGKILIVDDEPGLLKMMKLFLERRGYSVETVDRTEDAWERLQANPRDYAILVLDATMEGLTAPELAARALGSIQGLCVIMASGYPLDTAALESTAPGRVAFLLKPFGPEAMAKSIRRMLGEKEEDV